MSRPCLAIAMGDPAGIGPELCCRIAADATLSSQAELQFYGSRLIFERVAERCRLSLPGRLIDCGETAWAKEVEAGRVCAAAGRLARAALEAATAACISRSAQALVTAPITKAAMALAGFPYPGHTEYLAAACGGAEVAMALHGPDLTVALATIHCPLAEVSRRLSADQIERVGRLLNQALYRQLGRPPRLTCLGLNPHAGEGGLFGDEEARLILPALQRLRADGIAIAGPVSADTAFVPAARAENDGYLACYHDQGLIPFKMLHFHDGVNWTLGLPIIRTSPDHGSAHAIAWQGKADATSLRAACQLALRLAS
ncbi:MAG: 4-hydroxythreonine-4-phosphate dehydrogenase PdxA [Planctomycetota bacterium]|nr:MAG: 4-hydroxythreonine-4-phosphate dehydrogenase PdxA [Planctomycetota bacterium]